MGYAFISYSTKNKTSADAFKALFDRNHIPSWMAPYDIPIGKNYAEVIIQVLKDCSCLILLLSNDAMNSTYVPREVERAIGYHKPIFPAQLEHVVLNEEFEFYISRNQIVAVNKIDESSPEIQQLLTNVRTCCTVGASFSQTIPNTPPQTLHETDNTPFTDLPYIPLHVGDIIDGKYRIEKHLAQFDNYSLYISFCQKTNKKYFIKACKQDASIFHSSTPTAEANMLKALSHPSLARLLDIVTYKDFLLTIFEFPEGDFLSDLISTKKSFSENEILHLGLELCNVLKYLYTQEHEKGYHCITPDNIIYNAGNFHLLDFYRRTNLPDAISAKKTNYFFYFAPEILNNIHSIDCKADIYGIGTVLYAIATKNDPTYAPYAIYPLHTRCPHLSAGLIHIITKCMESDPQNRYESLDQLSKELNSVDKLTKKLTRKNFFKELFKK